MEAGRVRAAFFEKYQLKTERGIDHGVFIPLILMYPDTNIPVTQLSLIRGLNPTEHLELGEALKPLLERNILIIGSGFSFYNMTKFSADTDYSDDGLNSDFQDWLINVCSQTKDPQNRRSFLEKWEGAPNAAGRPLVKTA